MTGRNRGPQSPDCIKAPPQNHSPLNRGALLPLIVARFPFNPAVNMNTLLALLIGAMPKQEVFTKIRMETILRAN